MVTQVWITHLHSNSLSKHGQGHKYCLDKAWDQLPTFLRRRPNSTQSEVGHGSGTISACMPNRQRCKNILLDMNPRLAEMADDDEVYQSAAPAFLAKAL